MTSHWLIDWLIIDWLIDWLIYVPFKNFSLIWKRHHCRCMAANLGRWSAPMAFEQGGIFIVPHQVLLWHGASVFPVSSEGLLHSVAFLRHIRGCGESILAWSSRVPIQLPFTSHKGVWRTYFSHDTQGTNESYNGQDRYNNLSYLYYLNTI
jgi:hypothetical protein